VTELTKAFLRPRIRVGREYVTKAQTKEQVVPHTDADVLMQWTLANFVLLLIFVGGNISVIQEL